MKFSLPKAFVATESEYRAHDAGLNTFFGAVLGFVMAATERLNALAFGYILLVVSAVVISVLYVSASRYKFSYAILTLAMIALLPRCVEPFLGKGEQLPEKLQPTLLVWTLLTIIVEYLPRRPDDPPATEP